jgi:cytidylate kinase
LEPTKRKAFIIAIDGPSGAGKSTAAKSLAKRLGYLYIDTGAMYRAVALKAREKATLPEDEESLCRWVSSLHLSFHRQGDKMQVLCDGEDVTEAIRSPEMSLLASEISKKRGVRQALVSLQREMGSEGGVVLEGRDIGTVVFPDADVKFYLDAEAGERARRRFEELAEKHKEVGLKEIFEEVTKRDHNDRQRQLSPLRKAEDALLIDSTHRSAEEVVEEMLRIIMAKKMGAKKMGR